jgi:hypothetical protein
MMYYGRQLMDIPQGGASVRQCAFFVPALQIASDATNGAQTPTVTATIDNQGVGAGTIMGIYSLVVVQNGVYTEIAVSAQNLAGGAPLPGDYFCNVIVIGTPIQHRA